MKWLLSYEVRTRSTWQESSAEVQAIAFQACQQTSVKMSVSFFEGVLFGVNGGNPHGEQPTCFVGEGESDGVPQLETTLCCMVAKRYCLA